MKINKETRLRAEAILETASSQLDELARHPSWGAWLERAKQVWALEERTYFPMYGTSLLARALDPEVDVFAIREKGGGYSARSLCHNVLVPFVRRKGWSLKATGDEPLNNQPFFRVQESLKEHVKVKNPSSFKRLIEEMEKVQGASPSEALIGLAAFLWVCRYNAPRPRQLAIFDIKKADLVAPILREIALFVRSNSEGGRVGQALVAAALDASYGPERVRTSRVNDPSRDGFADVQVLFDESGVAAVYEVKQRSMPSAEESFHSRLSGGVKRAVFVDLSSSEEGASFRELEGRFALRIDGVNTFLWYTIMVSIHPVEEWLTIFLSRFYHRLQELEVRSDVLEVFRKILKLFRIL